MTLPDVIGKGFKLLLTLAGDALTVGIRSRLNTVEIELRDNKLKIKMIHDDVKLIKGVLIHAPHRATDPER